jgi:hypothetical protein
MMRKPTEEEVTPGHILELLKQATTLGEVVKVYDVVAPQLAKDILKADADDVETRYRFEGYSDTDLKVMAILTLGEIGEKLNTIFNLIRNFAEKVDLPEDILYHKIIATIKVLAILYADAEGGESLGNIMSRLLQIEMGLNADYINIVNKIYKEIDRPQSATVEA